MARAVTLPVLAATIAVALAHCARDREHGEDPARGVETTAAGVDAGGSAAIASRAVVALDGHPTVRGAPLENVEATVQGELPRIRAAYTRALTRDPAMKGAVTLTLSVDGDGKVRAIDAVPEGVANDVVEAARAALAKVPFDPPSSAAPATVTVRLAFAPSAG